MKKDINRLIRLILGLFLFALGVVMTINANLGVAPWDVLHLGISKLTHITVGRANIFMGMLIVLLDIALGQPIGWATILNMILIGTFIDLLMANNLVPVFKDFLPSIIMLFLGMLVNGYACYIYMSAELGSGPRDGLMVILSKRTGKSVRLIKGSVEIAAVTIGYIMGGKIGIGTLLLALFGGFFFQFAFKTVNFNVHNVNHRYIKDDIAYIRNKLQAYEKE